MTFKAILRYFLIWQVLIIFIVSWSNSFFPLQTTFIGGGEQASFSDPMPYIRNPVLYFRGNFDGIHYINLARRGIGLYEEAFFPLYPKIIKLLHSLIRNTVLNGSLISSAFFLLGLINFVKLVNLDNHQRVSYWSMIALLVFPVSFFFSSVYTEGLFFFLSVTAFYFARQKRWWLAAGLVAAATNTRLVGIFLIPALFIELLYQNPKLSFRLLLPFILMPLGLASYMYHLWQIKADPLAFIHVQKSFGQGRSDKIVLLYQVVYRYVRMLTTVSPQNPLYATLALESFIALSFITIGIIQIFKKDRPSYVLFSLSSLILPTLTGTFTSIPRYSLLCFPIFIFLGQYLNNHKLFRYIYFTVNTALAVYFLAMFARGYWVA